MLEFKRKSSKDRNETNNISKIKINDIRSERDEFYQKSDGHWYRWIDDGRGGYEEVVPNERRYLE